MSDPLFEDMCEDRCHSCIMRYGDSRFRAGIEAAALALAFEANKFVFRGLTNAEAHALEDAGMSLLDSLTS